MREMHKWKDKVEFNLDNRQIFFLFFGLSVVGCFVFALGVMVGRRVDFGTGQVGSTSVGEGGEVAALSGDSLSLLDALGEDDALAFKEGLAEPAHEDLPQTRDPDAKAKAEDEDDEAAKVAQAEESSASAKPEPAKDAAKETEDASDPDGAVLSGRARELSSDAKTDSRKFTLQMKAFAKEEDAKAFAAPLEANGHDVRVEAHEIKGRVWYRVRVGEYDDWTEGLAAKEAFETAEDIIAYVVRM